MNLELINYEEREFFNEDKLRDKGDGIDGVGEDTFGKSNNRWNHFM